MTLPTPQEFLLRFPEFGTQSSAVVEGALEEADRSVPQAIWSTFYTEGVMHLTAHLLSTRIMQLGNQVGTPSGQPMGEGFNSTLYGQTYQRLRDQLPLCGFAL